MGIQRAKRISRGVEVHITGNTCRHIRIQYNTKRIRTERCVVPVNTASDVSKRNGLNCTTVRTNFFDPGL
jgi:hypothetical protein